MKFPKSEDEVRDHWAYHKIVKYMRDKGMSNGYPVRVNLNDVFDEMARQEKFSLSAHVVYRMFWLTKTDEIRAWTAAGGGDASWARKKAVGHRIPNIGTVSQVIAFEILQHDFRLHDPVRKSWEDMKLGFLAKGETPTGLWSQSDWFSHDWHRQNVVSGEEKVNVRYKLSRVLPRLDLNRLLGLGGSLVGGFNPNTTAASPDAGPAARPEIRARVTPPLPVPDLRVSPVVASAEASLTRVPHSPTTNDSTSGFGSLRNAPPRESSSTIGKPNYDVLVRELQDVRALVQRQGKTIKHQADELQRLRERVWLLEEAAGKDGDAENQF